MKSKRKHETQNYALSIAEIPLPPIISTFFATFHPTPLRTTPSRSRQNQNLSLLFLRILPIRKVQTNRLSVICQIMWRISAMINANGWLGKRVETFLRKFSASIKCLVTVAHLFGITCKKDNLVKAPFYAGRIDIEALVHNLPVPRNGLPRRLRGHLQTHPFLPYIMRKP